jgi:uncharacterized protein (TIGR03437 family)
VAAALLLLAALVFRSGLWADDSTDQAPSFSSDSIVNSANGSSASLTPNVIASVFGQNLAYTTATVSLAEVGAGTLPTTLGDVQISVGNIFAPLLYVSPTQINFLVPANLQPGDTGVRIVRQGTAGQAQITLLDAAPALFLVDNGKLAAIHADGSLVTADSPARASEIIVVFGTGLGRTDPRQLDGIIPRAAAPILLLDQLRIQLDQQFLPATSVLYAGITPGFPGLYQINLRLPDIISKKQLELRAALGNQMSQSALLLETALSEP